MDEGGGGGGEGPPCTCGPSGVAEEGCDRLDDDDDDGGLDGLAGRVAGGSRVEVEVERGRGLGGELSLACELLGVLPEPDPGMERSPCRGR